MRSINAFKINNIWKIMMAASLIVLAMLPAPLPASATPSQAGVSWNYKLLGMLNSAQDPGTGLTILITGSGTIDLSQNRVDGGGSYSILNAGGSVVGSGTWEAKLLDSFAPMGPGSSPGEGGKLVLEAAFKGTGTGALNVYPIHVVIQCSMWGPQVGPPGYLWPPDFIEVGPYTVHKTGGVMFNLSQ